MAALQTIRSKGAFLLIIIGIGLFAFIAEEFVRSIQTTTNESRQVAGSVAGNKITSQEFQQMLEEYKEALKFLRGNENFNEYENAQAEDFVWQSYVNNQLITEECDKLGLNVTDKELQDVLIIGQHPMLQQTPFVNKQKFDVNLLKNFLTEYDKMQSGKSEVPQEYIEQYTRIFKYWKFVEKTLRENILQQKYQMLLVSCILSNPVEAKMNYEATAKSADIQLAVFPLRNVNDNLIKVTDEDIKAKYAESKEKYHQYMESREIGVAAITVEASEQDKANLHEEMNKYFSKLESSDDLTSTVRSSNSQVTYNGIWITKNALPGDIQNKVDSMSPGSMKGPYYEITDNTENIIRLVGKIQAPDSIECQMIQVGGATAEEAHTRADSIYKAISAGAPFDSIAKKYNQNATKQWIVSNQYESAPTSDENNTKMLNTLNTMSTGELKNITFDQGNIIVKVTDRKAMTTKYNVAVIKRPVTFSKETYSKAYTNFSRYVANSTTPEELQKNASKYGLTFQQGMEVYSNGHFVASIPNTKEALRWIYNEDTKEGGISPVYECGENNTLLVVTLNKIHKKGYLPIEDVKTFVENEVKQDKKAEYLMKQYANIKSLEEAAQKGASIDSLNGVTFNSNTYISAAAANDPILNGSIADKKAGQWVGPVKGSVAVYFYKVLNVHENKAMKYNESEQMNIVRSQHLRNLQTFSNDLYINGNVKDKRYLFF